MLTSSGTTTTHDWPEDTAPVICWVDGDPYAEDIDGELPCGGCGADLTFAGELESRIVERHGRFLDVSVTCEACGDRMAHRIDLDPPREPDDMDFPWR
jgi:hypothetical protein